MMMFVMANPAKANHSCTLEEMAKSRIELRDAIITNEAETGRINLNYRTNYEMLAWKIADKVQLLYKAGETGPSKLKNLTEQYIAAGRRENTGKNFREYEHLAKQIAGEVESWQKNLITNNSADD